MRRSLRIRTGRVVVLSLLTAALLGAAAPPPPPPDDIRSGFRHPGVLLDLDGIDTLRRAVAQGREPQASAYRRMKESRYAAADYRPHPHKVVACPPYKKPPACTAEREDAIAAYTQALLYTVTRDPAHARRAVRIMDAWSQVLTDHTEGNSALQAAWAGSTWARAAELVRHTYEGWPVADAARFGRMLRHAYLGEYAEEVADYNGNWDLTMTDAALAIGVFLDDRRVFEEAVRRFKARVPAYFYLRSDGEVPLAPPGGKADTPEEIREFWFGQRTFVDGLAQESCRNFEHVGYALAATAHAAETAHLQGVDLYGPVRERLRATVEFHARHQLGAPMPTSLCGGRPRLTMGPDLEVVLHHLSGRLGLALPYGQKLAQRMRPAGTDDLFVAWETLTHGRAFGGCTGTDRVGCHDQRCP
ncbi:alginate lyase family protein [Streptomyces indicus]|uniref:Alginate lyase n=1 Tax=Streptomyces indicus TaxID=417292 RepID=A0A1G8UTF5_9ACTN|nr:alginate lyase family protein [Streptomyces indicus]SDJ57142.1 Alginate lyase [Streptomyces indicus]